MTTLDSKLLHDLGLRVRARRTALELTLAALAERSGVSIRFLSDLEAGRGNISVARLADIARALDVSPEKLLAAHGARTAESPIVDELVAEVALLSEEQAKEVLEWLRSRRAQGRSAEKVALIGLRGAGKTSLGKAVARRLHASFVELDAAVEQAAGMPLADLFAIHGEPYYRRLEREQLRAILGRKGRTIIATGGGIVTDPESYDLLRGSCFTVWLEATPEDHMERVVKQGDQRPMKGRQQAMTELRSILASRRKLYAQAHAHLDTSALGFESAAAELERLIR